MTKLLLVGAGGFLGSVARYALSGGVQRILPGAGFPYGTLAVNLLGCLLIGLLGAGADLRNLFAPETRALLFLGVLGAFTTFSTFAYETLALGRDGESLKVLLNVLLHLAGCLAAAWGGVALGRLVWGSP